MEIMQNRTSLHTNNILYSIFEYFSLVSACVSFITLHLPMLLVILNFPKHSINSLMINPSSSITSFQPLICTLPSSIFENPLQYCFQFSFYTLFYIVYIINKTIFNLSNINLFRNNFSA